MSNEKTTIQNLENQETFAGESLPKGSGLFISSPHFILPDNMYRGYVKLWRKIKDWIFFQKPLALALWITLLCEANHKPIRKIFNGKKITIQPGQLLTGRKYLAEVVGISEGTVEKYLNEFITEQQIIQQTSTKNRLITILRWKQYQNNTTDYTTHYTTEKQRAIQQNDTPNNDKKVKNEKNGKNEENYKEIICLVVNDLNFVLHTTYKYNSSKTRELIQARLNEGFTLEDFKTVHRKKYADWANTDMEKYLRPQTLYSNKFEAYLNQKAQPPKRKERYECDLPSYSPKGIPQSIKDIIALKEKQ